MEMTTDPASTFTSNSVISVIGYDMSKLAADRLFAKTQYTPQDVDVIELHDCFSANELITYEALGLCPPGRAAEMVGDTITAIIFISKRVLRSVGRCSRFY